jgi:beta-galactosidase
VPGELLLAPMPVKNIANIRKSTVLLVAGTLEMPDIEAGKRGHIQLPESISQYRSLQNNECWMTVNFTLKAATAWADAGHEIAWMQTRLNKKHSALPDPNSSVSGSVPKLHVHTTRRAVEIEADDFSAAFDRASGAFQGWSARGQRILAALEATSPSKGLFHLSFWRPPTDNDAAWQTSEWKRWSLDALTVQSRHFELASVSNDQVLIRSASFIAPPVLAWGFDVETEYCVCGDGSIRIKTHVKPQGSHPDTLPRIGWEMKLPNTFTRAEWLGLGPGESYHDKISAQKVGIHAATIDELHTPYEVPQENGNRMQTRWLKMLNERGVGFRAELVGSARTPGMFHFAASRYSAKELERARHAPELRSDGFVHLRLDLDCSGVGTGACGPTTKGEDLVKCEEVEFELLLEPVVE